MTETGIKHQAKQEEWEEKIRECRRSGQTVVEWCRGRGVSTTTYYRWERELFGKEKSREVPAPPQVAEGSVFAQMPMPKVVSSCMPAMTIRVGVMEIEVHRGVDAEALAALCRVLKEC